MFQAAEHRYGTQVRKHTQVTAQAKNAALNAVLARLPVPGVVPDRSAGCAEQYRISAVDTCQRFGRQGSAVVIEGVTAERQLLGLEAEIVPGCGRTQHLEGRAGHFRADEVARQDS